MLKKMDNFNELLDNFLEKKSDDKLDMLLHENDTQKGSNDKL